MPPSERTAAATATGSGFQADQDDDIVDRTPSHPVTTTLLIVSSVAIIFAIGLSGSELGRYVNKRTKEDLQGFKTSATSWSDEEYKKWWREQHQKLGDADKNFTDDEFRRLYNEDIAGEPVTPKRGRARKAEPKEEPAEPAPAPAPAPEKSAPAAEEKPAEGGGEKQ